MSVDRARMGDKIRELRKAARLTQQQLGDKLGITGVAIHQFERGITMPSVTSFVELADALGVSFGVLLGDRLALAEHAVAQVRAEVRALGFDLALIPRDKP